MPVLAVPRVDLRASLDLHLEDGTPTDPLEINGIGWRGSREKIPMENRVSSRPVRVVLVEDHTPTREAIASEFEPHFDFDIVGQAASLAEARELLASADVVILDLGLPDGSGAELLPEIRAANPSACALVLSATYDRALHARAIEHGAAAALDKVTHLGHLAETVRRLLAGERLVPPEDEDL